MANCGRQAVSVQREESGPEQIELLRAYLNAEVGRRIFDGSAEGVGREILAIARNTHISVTIDKYAYQCRITTSESGRDATEIPMTGSASYPTRRATARDRPESRKRRNGSTAPARSRNTAPRPSRRPSAG